VPATVTQRAKLELDGPARPSVELNALIDGVLADRRARRARAGRGVFTRSVTEDC